MVILTITYRQSFVSRKNQSQGSLPEAPHSNKLQALYHKINVDDSDVPFLNNYFDKN